VPDRGRYRYVYIVMVRFDTNTDGPHLFPTSVFVTRDEAEEAKARLTSMGSQCWIEAARIAV
jgi:hypothetical protein